MKNRMPRKKKRRNSVELTAIKRFEKSRSRRTCPAFQNTETVFCGDWGGASTSMKPWVSAKAEICGFRKVGPALHCLPLSRTLRFRVPEENKMTAWVGRHHLLLFCRFTFICNSIYSRTLSRPLRSSVRTSASNSSAVYPATIGF